MATAYVTLFFLDRQHDKLASILERKASSLFVIRNQSTSHHASVILFRHRRSAQCHFCLLRGRTQRR